MVPRGVLDCYPLTRLSDLIALLMVLSLALILISSFYCRDRVSSFSNGEIAVWRALRWFEAGLRMPRLLEP